MALTEDLARLMGFDSDNNAEVNIKIKPLTAAAAAAAPSEVVSPAGEGTSSATNVPNAANPPIAQTPESVVPNAAQTPQGFGPGGASIVPQAQRVSKQNPTLVTHPLNAQTDDIYEAAVAQLAFNTQQRYAQLLQEMGWIGEGGQFMPGLLETEAVRGRAEVTRQRELALQQVIEDAVRRGTVFSGRRAQLQSQAQQPYDTALAGIETTLSRELANRYQALGGLGQEFEIQRNMLIAEAAQRIAAMQQGYADGGPTGEGAPPSGGSDVQTMRGSPLLTGRGAGQTSPNVPPALPQGWFLVSSGTTYNGRTYGQAPVPGGRIVVDKDGNVQGYVDPNTGRFEWWRPPANWGTAAASRQAAGRM